MGGVLTAPSWAPGVAQVSHGYGPPSRSRMPAPISWSSRPATSTPRTAIGDSRSLAAPTATRRLRGAEQPWALRPGRRRRGIAAPLARRSLAPAVVRTAEFAFGPRPPPPPQTAEELYAEEVYAVMMSQDMGLGDYRFTTFTDSLRECVESGDWRGACATIEDMWKADVIPDAFIYNMAIGTCMDANQTDSLEAAAQLQEELRSWGDNPDVQRFQLSPGVKWTRQLRQAGCCVHNTLDWKGKEPLPEPPAMPRGCWLLPSQDDGAEDIAYWEIQLQQLGWKILTSNPDVIARLRSKSELLEFAESLGLSDKMPRRFTKPAEAIYPCILKPAKGTWGKNTQIVHGSEEVLRIMQPSKIFEIERAIEQQIEFAEMHSGNSDEEDDKEAWIERYDKIDAAVMEWIEGAEWDDLDPEKWVMQELITGSNEYSTTFLVKDGEILDYVCSKYQFESNVYVWPVLEYSKAEYVSVNQSHLEVMKAFLPGFSGVCNFNYKLRANNTICIFEMNPRVGGDLVFDVPKPRVRALFEKLDAMCS